MAEFGKVYMCFVEVVDGLLLLSRRYAGDDDCPALCGPLELYRTVVCLKCNA